MVLFLGQRWFNWLIFNNIWLFKSLLNKQINIFIYKIVMPCNSYELFLNNHKHIFFLEGMDNTFMLKASKSYPI